MSDFLNKVKSIFIVEAEGNGSAATSSPAQPAQTAPGAPASVSVSTPSGAVNGKFVDILFGAIEKSNQDGFDYFEFKQALKNLAKMNMDEETKFQSAFALAQTMGATPAKLVESAKFYLTVLNGEQAKFNEAHSQRRAQQIGNREDDIKNLEATIQQKSQQIQQLTQQIEEHRRQSEQIRREVSDSTLKIEATKADFEATFNVVMGELQGDVSKIQQYLK